MPVGLAARAVAGSGERADKKGRGLGGRRSRPRRGAWIPGPGGAYNGVIQVCVFHV